LKLDSAPPKVPLERLWASERRFQMLKDPLAAAQADVQKNTRIWKNWRPRARGREAGVEKGATALQVLKVSGL